MAIGLSQGIAQEAASADVEAMPAETMECLRHAILDWLGVAIAGRGESSAVMMRNVLIREGSVPASTLIGVTDRLGPRQAALANAVASHALDFDDLGLNGCHPSAVILPAVTAIGEYAGAAIDDVLAGYLAGYQALGRLSFSAGWSAHRRGFHATGVFGTVAAAAGCARALRLGTGQAGMAVGLACTQAAGIKASFGTMGKHLNAGNAAANGVFAALLAAEGFIGPDAAIERSHGLFDTHNGDLVSHDSTIAGSVLRGAHAVKMLTFKIHASCGGTHSTIDSIRQAMTARGIGYDDVREAEIVIAEDYMSICGIEAPSTSIEGKFSLWHAAALALRNADTGLAGFEDEAVTAAANVAARARVRIVPVKRLVLGDPTEVTLHLVDGSTAYGSVDPSICATDEELPDQWQRLVRKFDDVAGPVIGRDAADAVVNAVRAIEGLESISQLMALSVPEPARNEGENPRRPFNAAQNSESRFTSIAER